MSDNDASAPASVAAAAVSKVIAEADQKFIFCLLSHVTGGTISVDIAAVATELGFTNPKSAANKMAKIKKDYGLPFVAGKAGSSAAAAAGETVEKTPKKTPAKAKTPNKRGPPAPDSDDEAAEAEVGTPAKKLKKSPVKKEPKAKTPAKVKEPKEAKVKTPAKAKVPKTPTKTKAAPKTPTKAKGKKSALKIEASSDDEVIDSATSASGSGDGGDKEVDIKEVEEAVKSEDKDGDETEDADDTKKEATKEDDEMADED